MAEPPAETAGPPRPAIQLASPSARGAEPQRQEAVRETAEVSANDVIRLVLQFLKENQLTRTYHSLQEESGVELASVDSKDRFIQEVSGGNLVRLLEVCGDVALPLATLFDVFEHVGLELSESSDRKALGEFMKSSVVFDSMAKEARHRFRRLQLLAERETVPSREEVWGQNSKHKQRKQIARAVAEHLQAVPPNRLMALLNLAMKMQRSHGLITPGTRFDAFRSMTLSDRQGCLAPATNLRHTIALPSKRARIFSAAFSPDGHSLVTGDSDGDILVWSWVTGELRTDLEYQKKGFFMYHDNAEQQSLSVTALAFSDDGKLASGDKEGNIKFWDIASGKLLRGPEKVHMRGVTSIGFHPTEPQIVTGSLDGTAKIFYPASRTVGKTFGGHEGFVHGVIFDGNKGQNVVTVSSDGSMRVFGVKSGKELAKMALPHAEKRTAHVPLQGLCRDRRADHQYFICSRSENVHCMNTKGDLIKTYKVRGIGDQVGLTSSPNSEWLLAVSEQGDVNAWDPNTGELMSTVLKITNGGGGIVHHPLQNVVCVWGQDNKAVVLDG